MARFIAIDNGSGYIFGDSADLNGQVWIGDDPLDFALALDESLGEHGRIYEDVWRLASNETGYEIYRADINGSEAVAVIHDGQDKDEIRAVEEKCQFVMTVRCISPYECG